MHAAEADVASTRRRDESIGWIHVLLPIHNRRSVTERFVRNLIAQTDQRFRLVLIDDGSSDGSADMVCDLLPNATILRGSGAWWWAGCLQQGYLWLMGQELSANDIVLIGNDDTRFDLDFLARGRDALATSRRSLLLAQLYADHAGSFAEVGARVDWRTFQFTAVMEPGEVNCLSTRGLFLFAREFLELGGFHPRLLPHYGSDYEFSIRAQRRGFELRSDHAVRLWYDETTTGIRRVSSESVGAYLRTSLSRRSVANPFYLTTFIFLACPPRHLPRNVLRVWRRFFSGLLAARRGAL